MKNKIYKATVCSENGNPIDIDDFSDEPAEFYNKDGSLQYDGGDITLVITKEAYEIEPRYKQLNGKLVKLIIKVENE